MKNYDCRFVLGNQRLGVVLQAIISLPDNERPGKVALAKAAQAQLRATWHDSTQLNLSVLSGGGPISNLTVVLPFTTLTEDNLVEWHPIK